jgi:hypothetical protein
MRAPVLDCDGGLVVEVRRPAGSDAVRISVVETICPPSRVVVTVAKVLCVPAFVVDVIAGVGVVCVISNVCVRVTSLRVLVVGDAVAAGNKLANDGGSVVCPELNTAQIPCKTSR